MPMQVDIDKVVAAAGSAGYQPATEVLVCRPRRNVQVPVFLQPSEALRDYVTGSRKRKRPAEEPIADDGECCKKPACAAARAERGKLRGKLETEAVAHMRLREQLRELASKSAEGDDAVCSWCLRPQLRAHRCAKRRCEEHDKRKDSGCDCSKCIVCVVCS